MARPGDGFLWLNIKIDFASAGGIQWRLHWACKGLEKCWASVLYLGSPGKQVAPCPSPLLPIPCTDQGINPTCDSAVRKGSAWRAALQKPLKWCMDMATHGSWLLLPCVWLGKYLLQSGTRVQVSLKAEACQDTDSWCSLPCRLWPANEREVGDSGLGPSQIGVKQGKHKSKDFLAGFSQRYIRYAKKTFKWDLLFCDYSFSFELLQCLYIPMKYWKHLSLYRR